METVNLELIGNKKIKHFLWLVSVSYLITQSKWKRYGDQDLVSVVSRGEKMIGIISLM